MEALGLWVWRVLAVWRPLRPAPMIMVSCIFSSVRVWADVDGMEVEGVVVEEVQRGVLYS